MIVTIPSPQHHGGFGLISLEISDLCPVCNGPRGQVFGTLFFDGSRLLNVDGWYNPCGHIDYYDEIRKEGKPVAFKEPTKDGFYAEKHNGK